MKQGLFLLTCIGKSYLFATESSKNSADNIGDQLSEYDSDSSNEEDAVEAVPVNFLSHEEPQEVIFLHGIWRHNKEFGIEGQIPRISSPVKLEKRC